MAKRRKKNQITLISLLVATVFLSVFYIWYINRDKLRNKGIDDSTSSSDTDSLILATMDPDLIEEIHFRNENADMTFILEEDVWVLASDRQRPIKQNNVKGMVGLVDEVKANRLVSENPKDLEQYGLTDPYAVLVATQSDGKSLTISIGNQVTAGKGYYAQLEGDNSVYILPELFGTYLSYSDDYMTLVEHGPNIDATSIFHIEVLNEDGNDIEIIYDSDSKYHDAVTPIHAWAILKPYGQAYSADGSKISDLLSNYNNFRFLTCVEYDAKDYDKYGLMNPQATVAIEYYQQQDDNTETIGFKLHIGDMDDKGDYYVRKDGDKAVYTMNSAAVERMLNVDSFSLLSPYINIYTISDVDKIVIETEGKTYTFEIKREIITNEDGEETKSTYYFNDQVTEEALFKDLYKIIINAMYDVELDEEVSISELEPVLTMSFYIKGSSLPDTTSYYPYGDSLYLVDSGYPIIFAADKRKIDKLIDAVSKFNPVED